MITEILQKKNGYVPSGKFRVSSIGGCWKSVYREMVLGEKTQFDVGTRNILDDGTFNHHWWTAELMDKCRGTDWEVASAELKLPEDTFVTGRTDILLVNTKTGEKFILDWKTISAYALKMIEGGDYSSEQIQKYIWQLNLYLYFYNIERGFLVFIHRGKIAELEVKLDRQLAEKQYAEIKDFMINNVEKKIEPTEKCKGNPPFGCKICGIEPFKKNNGGNNLLTTEDE